MFTIRPATLGDEGLVLGFIRDLAIYEMLEHMVEATEDDLRRDLFGPNPRIFSDIAEWGGKPAGFALWFYTYSSFRGRHGIWLEDLFVSPELRGHGIGKALLVRLARRCVAEDLGRLEWTVLDWNTPSIEFYASHGAQVMNDWSICRVDGDALTRLGSLEA